MADEFDKALANFISETASGGQIRALAKQGLPVRRICERLDFPTPFEKVQKIVWEHYLKEAVILTVDPKELGGEIETVKYVREYGKYGKADFRKVTEKRKLPFDEYIACDFGKLKYQDKVAYDALLRQYDGRQREYIDDLPWPLVRVWHAKKLLQITCRSLEDH